MKKLIYAALFVLVAATAHAQVPYTSRAAYDLVHPGNYVITFDNLAIGAYPSGVTAASPGGNITFTGTPQTPTAIEILPASSFGFPAGSNNVLYDNGGQFAADSLLITLPANTFSFGTDIISPSQTVAEPYKFTLFNGVTPIGTVLASPSINGTYTFVGFDSPTAITSIAVQITNAIGNPEPVLDNFTVVPEPSTWLAAALALGVIGFSQRKRVRACASFAVKKHS
jgi:hypothetical protein